MDIAQTVDPLTYDYCTNSRSVNIRLLHQQSIWIKPLLQNRDVSLCVAITMGARLDLYKIYYPNPDYNPHTNPKPDPHPHFGIVVRSKSAMHRQTDIVLLTVHGSTIFRRFVNSVWCRFLCRVLSSGVSHIKLTMRLLLKQM